MLELTLQYVEPITVVWLFFWLVVKHFIVDYPLQGPFQFRAKGTYGGIGGILHGCVQGFATTCIILITFPDQPALALALGVFDAVIHYHVDWLSVRTLNKLQHTSNTDEQFWWIIGTDQLLHMLTYVVIVAVIVNVL